MINKNGNFQFIYKLLLTNIKFDILVQNDYKNKTSDLMIRTILCFQNTSALQSKAIHNELYKYIFSLGMY